MLHSAVVVGLTFTAYLPLVATPTEGTLASDVLAYWRVVLTHPYADTYGDIGSFAVTLVAMPTQWMGWVTMLADSAGTPPPWPALPIPLWLRLPAAAALVWWGARRDKRWTVPLSAALALPALWPGGFAILAACWRLNPATDDYHAPDVVRSSIWTRAARLVDRPRPA